MSSDDPNKIVIVEKSSGKNLVLTLEKFGKIVIEVDDQAETKHLELTREQVDELSSWLELLLMRGDW